MTSTAPAPPAGWTLAKDQGVSDAPKYHRALWGSEILLDQFTTLAAGQVDVQGVFTLSHPFEIGTLPARLSNAWLCLLLDAPGLLAKLVPTPPGSSFKRQLEYTHRATYAELLGDAKATLHLHIFGGDDDQALQVALDDLSRKLSGSQIADAQRPVHLHALVPKEGANKSIGLILHGIHVHIDARALLLAIDRIAAHLASESDPAKRPWSGQVQNLLPHPQHLFADEQPSAEALAKAVQENLAPLLNFEPTPAVLPARSAPSILGQSSRRMRSLTIAHSQQVYAAVKRLGATVGATFDAALRLAVLFQAASQHGSSTERLAGQWKDRKFVLFPVHVDQRRWYKQPQRKSCIASAITAFTSVLDLSDLAEQTPEQILPTFAQRLTKEYSYFLKDSTIGHYPDAIVRAAGMAGDELPPTASPHAFQISNVGMVEDFVQLSRPVANADQGSVKIESFAPQLRLVAPFFYIHYWSLGGRLHLSACFPDIYDASQLDKLLDDAVALLRTL